MTLATLSEAIEWAERHWSEQRPVPVRLHQARTTDGALGGPMYTHAFAAALGGSVNTTTYVKASATCHHPMLRPGLPSRDCPECYGTAIKDVQVDRYAYPMSRALSKLSNVLRPRRQPHPYRLVTALADHGWDARVTARSLDMHHDLAEPLLLRALRQLHSRYEASPVRIPHHDKSESQQRAEAVPIAS